MRKVNQYLKIFITTPYHPKAGEFVINTFNIILMTFCIITLSFACDDQLLKADPVIFVANSNNHQLCDLNSKFARSDMKIIRLEAKDWGKYRDLRLRSVNEFPQAFGSTYEEEFACLESDWVRRLQNMFFIQDGSEIIGMLGISQDGRTKIKHIALLYSVYVIPEKRNKGIMSLLLTSIFNQLQATTPIKKIILYVTVTQQPAIRLYKKLDFHINGIMEDGYCLDGQFYDQYIMTKNL